MSAWESSGKTDEWYTPKYIFDAMECTFDLDVAHPSGDILTPSKSVICEDSLDKIWEGFVWMNPPFGGRNSLIPWVDKFFIHGNGIALTPDRTSAPWYQYCLSMCDGFLLIAGKVKFLKPDGTVGKSPSTGTTLWASGDKAKQVLSTAALNGLGRYCEVQH